MARLTVSDRFGEIRYRLIMSVLFLVLASIVGYFFAPQLLSNMVENSLDELIFLSPTEALFTRIRLALSIGFILSLPVILFHVWRFASRDLPRKKKFLTFFLIPASFGLFMAGSFLAYKLILPVAINFMMGFATAYLEPLISVSKYVAFALAIILPLGLIFELPLVILFLSYLKIISADSMVKNRKYVILMAFIVGALLTPPDAFTQIAMAIPIIILYEISILIARIFN